MTSRRYLVYVRCLSSRSLSFWWVVIVLVGHYLSGGLFFFPVNCYLSDRSLSFRWVVAFSGG